MPNGTKPNDKYLTWNRAIIAPPHAPPTIVAIKAFLNFVIKENRTGSVTPINAVIPVDKPTDLVFSFFDLKKIYKAHAAIAELEAAEVTGYKKS